MVTECHPYILKMGTKWKLIRDFVAGENEIKAAGPAYLPMKSGQTKEDYDKYKARAKPGDYTDQALKSMHGLIFRRTPVVEKPDDTGVVGTRPLECVKVRVALECSVGTDVDVDLAVLPR